jgi:hypothetical protein
MKYKIVIDQSGQWTSSVVDPGVHRCHDIVQTIGSFGEIVDVKNKKDDVPVHDSIHVNGRG